MKTTSKLTLLALSFLVLTTLIPQRAHAQASTEGREFWVALTFAVTPPDGDEGDSYYKTAEPYIAVSAPTKGTVITVTAGTSVITYTTTADNEWYEFKGIPIANWYPAQLRKTSDVPTYAGQIKDYGVHVSSTEDISVFSILRVDFDMDATNILPTATLQSEYIFQDIWPEMNDDGVSFATPALSMATILATEDNTQVQITPTSATQDNKPANTPYTVTLNRGQVYYLIGKDGQLLNGTHILAQNNKKIAVFLGNSCTRIPAGIGARDCLYEQAMPVDYWGTQFVLTRSMNKDGNIFGITAMENGTEIKIGRQTAYIDRGETYYIELHLNNPATKNANKLLHKLDANQLFQTDALYLETSCPCAVYNYDTGSSYKGDNSTMADKKGDPSVTWIAPIQQSIRSITFGTCHTDKTTKHNINIICPTAAIDSTKLSSNLRPNIPLTFVPVPNNPAYSYVIKELTDDEINSISDPVTGKDIYESVFHLTNSEEGFIAHVYGHGTNESFAYSVGSATVKRAIDIDGTYFTDGYREEQPFCLDSTLNFNAQVGQDIIEFVDWDFGDGITLQNGPAQVTHTYDSPGWYDLVAMVHGRKACSDEGLPADTLHFSFRIQRPISRRTNVALCQGEEFQGKVYDTPGEFVSDPVTYDCDSVVIYDIFVGAKSPDTYVDTIAEDILTLYKDTLTHLKTTYTSSNPDAVFTLTNDDGCDSVVHYNIHIITTLVMSVTAPVDSCNTSAYLDIPYKVTKGDMGDAWLLTAAGDSVGLIRSKDYFSMPRNGLPPDNYTAYIMVVDANKGDTLRLPINFQIYYPASVFKFKFGNVLAVYKPAYNGGYVFTDYQWYLNGERIQDATTSIYHTTDPFTPGDVYSVLLTRADGTTIMSCPYTIPESATTLAPQPAAQKVIRNQHMRIIVGDNEYDIYGIHVQ